MEDLDTWLTKVVDKKASDLFITVGVPPTMKVHGEIHMVQEKSLSPGQTKNIVLSMMDDKQKEEFERTKELNFVIQRKGLGRFRVSAFQQRSSTGAVLRRIETDVPTLEELGMPLVIRDFALLVRGLVLVVGGSGTGKSSTLAAMVQHRNQNSRGHIVSIEDPIEYIHKHDGCIVTQREIGIDTESFEVALKNALRQAPNVILIGEIRNRETMEYALEFAETGHLCLATLHANNANQALERILSFFPHDSHEQLCLDLSMSLKAVVAQSLVPRKEGKGQLAATEVLINTPVIAEHIRKGEIDILRDFMTRQNAEGMETYDQSLYRLYVDNQISYETALKYAESENEVRLMIKLDKICNNKDSGFSIKDDKADD